MCTAINYKTKYHYFGRNLDLEYSYNETVTITPRKYPFVFRREQMINEHYAMIGMAYVQDNYPLYYDATNEKGLSMAGLNFPGYAKYCPPKNHGYNITPFELIPWILGKCADVDEAEKLLKKTNIVEINYSEELPLSPLHWIVSDRYKSITVEPVASGVKIYYNPVEVLTNNPVFPVQMFMLSNYMGISNTDPINNFSNQLKLKTYSRGMGGLGLPGDWSSTSRFVKASFVKMNSESENSEEESVSQVFHILSSVAHPRGTVVVNSHSVTEKNVSGKEVKNLMQKQKTENKKYEITVYTSCCNTEKGIYYYTTYDNNRISAVNMKKEDLNTTELINYVLNKKQDIAFQN